MVKTIQIDDKQSIINFRKDLGAKGYQELRLEYKAGAYHITYSTEPINEVGLVYLGYKKNKPVGQEGHYGREDFIRAKFEIPMKSEKKNTVKQVLK